MAALKRPANGDAAPQTKKVRFDRNVTEKKHSTAESGGKFSKRMWCKCAFEVKSEIEARTIDRIMC